MKTDYSQLSVALQWLEDVNSSFSELSPLFNKAIGLSSDVENGIYTSGLSLISSNIANYKDSIADLSEKITKTIEMILSIDGYSDDISADLESFKLDDLNNDFYFYFVDDIVSTGGLDKTISINKDAEKNILYIYSYMINNLGYTHKGAMALLNNMGPESSFDPKATNASGAFGLCQWLDRKGNLISYANENGLDYNDIDTQLMFMDYELKNRFNSGNEQHRLYDQVTGTLDVSEEWLSGNITKIYERPVRDDDPNYYAKVNQVAADRYNSYNGVINDFIDANDVTKRDYNVGNRTYLDDIERLEEAGVSVSDNVSEISNNDNLNVNEVVDSSLDVNNSSSVSNSSTYVVQNGDSLDSIAKANGITWEELYNKNKDIIGNPNNIYPGQQIKL